jgi:hypothetical protein
MGNIIRNFLGKGMVSTNLSSSLMPTSAKKNGGSIFLTSPPTGSICAFTAFLFPVMSLVLSFDQHRPLNNLHLIQLPLSSAPSTSIGNAPPHSSRLLPTPIRTGIYGWTVIGRKNVALKASTLIEKLLLANIALFAKKGAPKAIPTMCILTIKKDENLFPLRAKSRIVALGNLEERVWSKSDCFAPVLRQDSLRLHTSLAVEKHRPLRQGDCKNAFCHGILPPEETMIVCPLSGDPNADPQ